MADTRVRAPSYNPFASYEVEVKDIVYRQDGGRTYPARVFQPRGQGPFPAVVEVHGGAWMRGDIYQNELLDTRLAASGVVVATVDFRLSDEAPYPASMADINYAVRWLKAHAEEFNASSVGAGGMGFSSGGHMIMLNAMRPRDPRYTAITLTEAPGVDAGVAYVVAGWPVMDPLSRFRYAATIDRQDLIEAGLKYFIDEAGMSEANPQHILDRGEPARLPPALIVHGAEDAQVTPKTVEIFTESYAQAGGVIELAKYPGEPHGFAREDTENTRRAIDAIKSFIARQLIML